MAGRLEELVEMNDANAGVVEMPPLILTSILRKLGIAELRQLVGKYEAELLAHVNTLARTLLGTLDTMVADLRRMQGGEDLDKGDEDVGDIRAPVGFRGTPEQRAELEAAMFRLVDRVCGSFRDRLTQHIQRFMRQFDAVRAQQTPLWPRAVTREFSRMGHHMTMKAVLTRGGGPWEANNGNYFDLKETLASMLSDPLQTSWRDLFARMEAEGTAFETEMGAAVNAALALARTHEYFGPQPEQNNAAALASLQPVASLRAEMAGNALPFHDHFYGEEINRSRRNFREDVQTAVGREARARGVFAPTPVGPGYVANTIGIMDQRIRNHGHSVRENI